MIYIVALVLVWNVRIKSIWTHSAPPPSTVFADHDRNIHDLLILLAPAPNVFGPSAGPVGLWRSEVKNMPTKPQKYHCRPCVVCTYLKIKTLTLHSKVSQKSIFYSPTKEWPNLFFRICLFQWLTLQPIGVLIRILISEHQGLEKSSSALNLRKTSGPAGQIRFQKSGVRHFLLGIWTWLKVNQKMNEFLIFLLLLVLSDMYPWILNVVLILTYCRIPSI